MTIKQRLLQIVYPVITRLSRLKSKRQPPQKNNGSIQPPVSFYTLSAYNIRGERIDFASLRAKKVLLVNVASQCGYTSQYAELEELYRRADVDIEIIGFPSNDFKGQEPGSDEEIETFCKLNYGVSFPLAGKASVTGSTAQPVFEWLSNKALNGWNDQPPGWNFYKYLLDEKGVLQQVFPSYISPLEIDFSSNSRH